MAIFIIILGHSYPGHAGTRLVITRMRGLAELVGITILVTILSALVLVYYTSVARVTKPPSNSVVSIVVDKAVKLSDGHTVYISYVIHNFGSIPLLVRNMTVSCCGETVVAVNVAGNPDNTSNTTIIEPGGIRMLGGIAYFTGQVPDYASLNIVVTLCRPGGNTPTSCVTAMAPAVVMPPVEATGT